MANGKFIGAGIALIMALVAIGYVAYDGKGNIYDCSLFNETGYCISQDGGLFVPTHYCNATKEMRNCIALSTTQKTCYQGEGKTVGKLCSVMWNAIPPYNMTTSNADTATSNLTIICNYLNMTKYPKIITYMVTNITAQELIEDASKIK